MIERTENIPIGDEHHFMEVDSGTVGQLVVTGFVGYSVIVAIFR